MNPVIRGREVTPAVLELIRALIASDGHRGRVFLSRELCRRWNWLRPNGSLKDAACRGLLLRLEDCGLIQLPARQRGRRRGMPRRIHPKQLALPIPKEWTAVAAMPDGIEWRLANAGPEALLYKQLVDTHHYLGFALEAGPVLRYLAYAEGRPIAAIGWAAAAFKVGCRDRLIGWSHPQRQRRLYLVANNTRFLILPRVPHLASRLLGQCVRRLPTDWQAVHGYAPMLLETFVDTTRFKGTCYRAANWMAAGLTEGRGKYDRHTRRAVPVKAVFLYPLQPDFRQVLTHD